MNRIKETAVLSTAYMPNIQYVSKFLLHETIVLDIHETYLKQSFRNRFQVASANGPLDLSLPILKPNGNRTITKDIEIDYAENWMQVHWRAIVSAYSNSPFFEIFEAELAPIYQQKEKYLIDFNKKVLSQLFACLGLPITISFTNTFIPINEQGFDFRNSISPKKRLQKPDEHFSPQPYYQVFSKKYDFVPNLSFLDLILNEGPQAISILNSSIRS